MKFTATFSTGETATRTSPKAYTHAYLVSAEASRSRSTCHQGYSSWKTGYSTSEEGAVKAARGHLGKLKSLGYDIVRINEVVPITQG
jgi:hypothetical protein